MALYIGLMSGTSLDGVDGVLIDIATVQGPPVALRAHHHQAFDASLRADLLALNAPGDNELHRAALAGNAIARAYAEVVQAVLQAGEAAPRISGKYLPSQLRTQKAGPEPATRGAGAGWAG